MGPSTLSKLNPKQCVYYLKSEKIECQTAPTHRSANTLRKKFNVYNLYPRVTLKLNCPS